MNPIERAVLPLKKDAIKRAKQEAEAAIQKVRDDLAAAGGDVNKAAPYPENFGPNALHGYEREAARMRYQKFHSLVMSDPNHHSTYRRNEPHFVVLDEDKVTRSIQHRMESAAADYDSFVVKLVKKIGEAVKAKLHGNHVWGYSTLIVTKPDGEVQAWKTQQIVNFSKLGKPFNQWPTRRLKKVPDLKQAA